MAAGVKLLLYHQFTTEVPTVKPVCPYDQTNIRSSLKPIVGQLCHMDRLTREHIYNAHHFDTTLLEGHENM